MDLEEQLKEVGNMLLSPPSSVDELTTLLDKAERLLANVEQAPSKSMQNALLPSMRALIANDLLRHSDMDVRLSVATCISEITRVTAPEAPYDDEVMKEIFQLSVAAFEKLSHVSGRSYAKAVSILDTVAKVRSCLVMLDLECDTLIIEMFQNFLKFVRSNHPHAVFSAMETIMTLVIDESEDISWDILSILLASVRNENQDVSPTSWKLGEKVFTNCAAKLKSKLMEAVQSRGIALDEYAEVVSYICKSGYETLHDDHLNDTGKYLVTKRLDSVCPGEVFHDVDDTSKAVKCNGTAPSRNEDYFVNNRSSKVVELGSYAESSRIIDVGGSAKPDNLDSARNTMPEIKPESARKKRGRKPNSLMNPEEGYDHSWISSGKKTPKVPGSRKSHDMEYDCSPSANPNSKKTAQLSTQKKMGEPSSPTPKSSLDDGSLPRRGWRKIRRSMRDQDGDLDLLSVRLKKSADTLEKELEDRHQSEIKRRKRSVEGELAVKTDEKTTRTHGCGVSENIAEVPSDLKEKREKLSATKARQRGIKEDKPSVQKNIKKQNLVVDDSTKSITEASGAKKKKISKAAIKPSHRVGNKTEETPPKTDMKKKHSAGKEAKKMISKVSAKSSKKIKRHSDETRKTEVKMKNIDGKDMDSETPGLGEQLVGRRIKVWWPLDKTFYEGVIGSYSHIKKKHRILYADGDEERLDLTKEHWELVGDGSSEGGQETNVLKPAASSDKLEEKAKTKFELVKEVKASSLKRNSDYAIVSKAKARKSGVASADVPTVDKSITVNESMSDAFEKDNSSKGDDQNSVSKLVVKDRKLILTLSKAQQTASPSKGESSKGGENSLGARGSGGEYLDNPREMNKEAKQENSSTTI